MTDYSTWSLKQLKEAAEHTQPAIVQQSAQYFSDGATAMVTSQDEFMRTLGSMQSNWKGQAAQAAIGSAQTSYAQMELTRASASDAQTSSDNYHGKVQAQKQQAASIQDVDTSWGHAAKSGWFGGLAGIGIAKYEQQQKYNAHRDQAAKVVQQMDTDGASQAATMRSMTWPSGGGSYGTPERNLPPVPSSAGRGGGSTGNYNYSPPGANGHGPSFTPVVPGPTVHQTNPDPSHGPGTTRPPGAGTTPPQGGPSPAPAIPTVPQGGTGAPVSPVGAPGGPLADGPPTTSAGAGGGPGGAAAAGGLLGGAGLLGAGGVLGGRAGLPGGRLGGLAEGEGTGLRGRGAGGLAEGEGTGLRGRGAGGLAEGEGTGLRGRGAGGLAEGEGTGLRGRGAGGLAEGEGTGLRGRGVGGLAEGEGTGLRAGARGIGGTPEEGLDPARRGMLRGGVPEGFAGEPVAAEAGRMGGYPMGGGGRRGGSDDEEAPMPDYLVETDDVWGDGKSAAPPVIGE